jgi:hypothetical protein
MISLKLEVVHFVDSLVLKALMEKMLNISVLPSKKIDALTSTRGYLWCIHT